MIPTIRRLLGRELRAMQREVEAYPDDPTLWKPVPGLPNSGGRLALHTAGNLRHFVGAVLGESGYVRDRDAEFSRTDLPRSELVAELGRAATEVDAALAGLAGDAATEPYPESALGGRRVSTGAMLAHLLSHAAYHLGQLDSHRRTVLQDPSGVSALSLQELVDLEPEDR